MPSNYEIKFINAQDVECKIHLDVSGATGPRVNLPGGVRPFVLKEFNSDMDYYKPIRPMLAEMEILASENISIDDFLNETSVLFYYGGTLYWAGQLIQDDFQETWIDSNHLFTLRATDNFDKQVQYPYRNGLVSFLEAITNVYGNIF